MATKSNAAYTPIHTNMIARTSSLLSPVIASLHRSTGRKRGVFITIGALALFGILLTHWNFELLGKKEATVTVPEWWAKEVKLMSQESLLRTKNESQIIWVVITSINYPTRAIKLLAARPDLRVVVVGDTKSPADYKWENVTFLSMKQQESLGYSILKHTPTRHYARKNVGYLYAVNHGARQIYETDDDNEMEERIQDVFFLNELGSEQLQFQDNMQNSTENRNVCNPYGHFGQPSVWPRGYPLRNIADPPCTRYRKSKVVRASIQQGLANGDPDVDAIFRLTRKDRAKDIRFEFDSRASPVAYPFGMFSPFNSQNTFFHYEALWALLIPTTTTFRVCDIWYYLSSSFQMYMDLKYFLIGEAIGHSVFFGKSAAKFYL
jgi:hypothetical protein